MNIANRSPPDPPATAQPENQASPRATTSGKASARR